MFFTGTPIYLNLVIVFLCCLNVRVIMYRQKKEYLNRIHLRTLPIKDLIIVCNFSFIISWFSYTTSAMVLIWTWTLTKFSMVENFVSYLRSKGAVLSKISKPREHYKCSECQLKLVATESGMEHDHCLHCWLYFTNNKDHS